MNARELVDDLKKVGHLFEWKIVSHTHIPDSPERRVKPRRMMRGICKDGPKVMVESALTLELSPQDAKDLVAAANDFTWRQVAGHRESDPYRQLLRQMAATIGLESTIDSLKKEIVPLKQGFQYNDGFSEIDRIEKRLREIEMELEHSFPVDSVPLSRLLQLRTTQTDLKSYLRGLKFCIGKSAAESTAAVELRLQS